MIFIDNRSQDGYVKNWFANIYNLYYDLYNKGKTKKVTRFVDKILKKCIPVVNYITKRKNILALTEHDVVSRVGGRSGGGGVVFAHDSVDRKVRGLFDRAGGMLFLVGRAHYHIITVPAGRRNGNDKHVALVRR